MVASCAWRFALVAIAAASLRPASQCSNGVSSRRIISRNRFPGQRNRISFFLDDQMKANIRRSPGILPRRSLYEDDMPLGDFSDLDQESLREFKKKMQISDREWADLGLPQVEDRAEAMVVDRSDDEEKLDQQAYQYVIAKLKEFRQDRDMGARELKLVLMAGLDAQDATRMTYEDESEYTEDRDGILIALEEIIETGKIPADRDALRQLATELAQMPTVNPEDKTRRMKKISAMEQGKEYVEEKKDLTPKDVGGIAAVWGVTAVPVLIGLWAVWILYTSSGTTVE